MRSVTEALCVLPLLAAVSYPAAAQLDVTYCEQGQPPTPYCDGVSLDFNGPNLTVFGTQTGCHSGSLGGSIVYSLGFTGVPGTGPGLGVTYGHATDYTDLAGEIVLAPPFAWRLINFSGGVVNDGILCFQPATASSGVAAGATD